VHGASRGLLAVAESGVEEDDLIGFGHRKQGLGEALDCWT
jgi:hypothetical protein